MENKETNIFYHYTSLDAIYNIIQSKTFRLTSLLSSNDKTELSYYSPDIFIEDFESICLNEENDFYLTKYIELLTSIKEHKDAFEQLCRHAVSPFGLCFASKRDNLTHWDRYADNCKGGCICVDRNVLIQHLRKRDSFGWGIFLMDIGKILYHHEEIIDTLRNSLNHLIDDFEKENKSCGKIGFAWAASIYKQIANFVKNPSFVDEDELRLYFDAQSFDTARFLIDFCKENSITNDKGEDIETEYSASISGIQIEQEHFCMTSRGIRSYHNLNLSEIWNSSLIPEIILGPMCIQNEIELKKFLKYYGLENTKILISEIPIR